MKIGCGYLAIMAVLSGCGGLKTTLVDPGSELTPYSESQGTPGQTAAVIDGLQWVLSDDYGMLWNHDASAEPLWSADEGGVLQAVVPLDGDALLLSVDDMLVVWDQEVQPSPLQEVLSDPVRRMHAVGSSLWLETDARTLVWERGALGEMVVAGQSVGAPIAANTAETMVWLGGEEMVGVRRVQGDWSVVEVGPSANVTSVAGAASDALWGVSQGNVLVRDGDGEWMGWQLPAPVTRVLGHRESAIVWLETQDGLWVYLDGQFHPVETPNSERLLEVDPIGRLWVQTEEGVERLGVSLRGQFSGMERDAKLLSEVSVQIVPSFEEWVSEVTAEVNGEPIALNEEDGSVTLNAEDLGDGAHQLDAVIVYADGMGEIRETLPFTVGSFEIPSFQESILPIHEASCAVCHDGDSETVLDSSDSWRNAIDSILEVVTSGTMPLVGDALSADEVALIRAWRAGGMLE